jgi:hypothetical protein
VLPEDQGVLMLDVAIEIEEAGACSA